MTKDDPNNIGEELNIQVTGEKKPSKKKKKYAFIVMIGILIFSIILGYFFTPLQEPINNFVLNILFGEPEVNVDITRSYVISDWNELDDWQDIFLAVKGGNQMIIFRSYIKQSPSDKTFYSFESNSIYPYNYWVYVKNYGKATAEDITVVGRIDTDDFKVFNVDSLIDIDPENKGGLQPDERTFRFEIKRLKPNETTSLKISPTNLSDVSIDCTLKRGKCNYGLKDHIIVYVENLPSKLPSMVCGKRKDIIIPDYRNKTDVILFYNFTNQTWVDAKQRAYYTFC